MSDAPRTLIVLRYGPSPDRWCFAEGKTTRIAAEIGVADMLGAASMRQGFNDGRLARVVRLAVEAGVSVVFPPLPPME